MSSALPPGWTLRPVELIDGDGPDVDRALAVITAHEDALGPPTEDTRESVRAYLAAPECERSHTVLVFDDAGRERGFLLAEVDELAQEVTIDAYSDPTVDLMPLLIEHGVAGARAAAAARGGQWALRTGHYVQDVRTDEALTAAGFTVVRHFMRMRINLDTSPLPPPVWPEGVTLEPSGTRDLAPVAHEVMEEAFADHWNHTARPIDEWWEHVTMPVEYHDPSLWWLVRVGGEPAALLIGTLSRAHQGDGYVRALAVRRRFRGRGLGRALLLQHFAESMQRGMSGVQLGVDATNPTGAVGLYESVGMRPVRHIMARELDVSAPTSSE